MHGADLGRRSASSTGRRPGLTVTDGAVVEGYASVFGRRDQGGDVVQAGAYARSLARAGGAGAAGEDAVAA